MPVCTPSDYSVITTAEKPRLTSTLARQIQNWYHVRIFVGLRQAPFPATNMTGYCRTSFAYSPTLTIDSIYSVRVRSIYYLCPY